MFANEWHDSCFSIDYDNYYHSGFRGIIFDIDNTLVPHGKMGDEELVRFIEGLKDIGFKIILVSNNSRERNKKFADPLGIDYIYKAGKPSIKGYQEACRRLEIPADRFLCIGDQLFTDIWGGNRAGMHTILVNPIDPAEEIQIILKRKLEKPVLALYRSTLDKYGLEYPDHRRPEGKAKIVNNLGEKGRSHRNR